MKLVLATLLLMFQLQPLAGAAACLALSDRAGQSDCEMPEHRAGPHSSIAQTESPAPNCALASVCAPSPLAVVILPQSLETIAALQSEAPRVAATLFGISSAPPFHPPRA